MKLFAALLILLLSIPVAAQNAGPLRSTNAIKVLEAFEIKSKSKTGEFFDYLTMLSDPKIDAEMKPHIKEQVQKLFGNKDVMVYDFFNKTKPPVKLSQLLSTALLQKQKYIFEVSEFTATRLQGSEAWNLNYTVVSKNSAVVIQQDYYLEKESKDFGSSKSVIVSAYLGEMKPL